MKTFVTLACILMSLELAAQVFPVHVTTQLVPPYSPYLSDYTAPGAQHLMVHIRANDITLSGYECRLRLTIEGAGILLRTDPNFAPRPLILQGGGIPEVLSGSDLQEYLHPHTLLFSGISKRSDHGRVRLPEGKGGSQVTGNQ